MYKRGFGASRNIKKMFLKSWGAFHLTVGWLLGDGTIKKKTPNKGFLSVSQQSPSAALFQRDLAKEAGLLDDKKQESGIFKLGIFSKYPVSLPLLVRERYENNALPAVGRRFVNPKTKEPAIKLPNFFYFFFA